MMTRTQNRPNRREERYAVRFPVRLTWNRRSYVSMVEDVSFSGMRIRTSAMPRLRLLVRVDLLIPTTGELVTMHAMVAHATLQDGCSQPSIGLKFYGVGEQTQSAWNRYVDSARVNAPPPDPSEISCITTVEPKTPTEFELVRVQASVGTNIFIQTELPIAAGMPLHAALIHPEDDDKMFLLEGVVETLVEDSVKRGAVVHFRRLDRTGREALKSFARTAQPPAMPTPAVA